MLTRLIVLVALAPLILAGCSHSTPQFDVSDAPDVAGASLKDTRVGRVNQHRGSGQAGDAPRDIRPNHVAYQADGDWRGLPPIMVEGTDDTVDDIVEARDYRLGAGDQVRVFVYGQPNLSRTYRVDGGGLISLPLVGLVRAGGRTLIELERRIAHDLEARFVKDADVSVEVATHRPFFILGEVRNAGQYPFVNAMTVRTAVAIAGGFSPRANERNVEITRVSDDVRETFEASLSAEVLPGDTVHVKERWF